MHMSTNRKVTCRRVKPNPLFEGWLKNMYEDSKLQKSNLEPMLKEATESLSKYPLPLKSGAECKILKGFDRRLCAYLDICLNNYNQNYNVSEYCKPRGDKARATCSDSPKSTSYNRFKTQSRSKSLASDEYPSDDISEWPELPSNPDIDRPHVVAEKVQASNTTPPVSTKNMDKSKAKEKAKNYKPAHRSGGYAILVALLEQGLENPDKCSLTKEELIGKAQKHSDESFVRPKPESFYTAWSSMTRLVKKKLIEKIIKKRVEYMLTEKGMEVAREILEEAKSITTVNDIIFNDINHPPPPPSNHLVPPSSKQNADIVVLDEEVPYISGNINANNVFEMAPGTFDIILLIDKNETGGLNKKNDPTVAQFKKYPDLKHEYRSLKVGDFTWIAKHKVNQDQELVLPFIIERKRMDDLGASIKDGRFHEQKFRLRKCGLNNVLYMVENYGKNKHVGLPIQNLMQALANTRVQDGFKVHMTDSLTNSARFLAMMTKRLTIRFKDKHLRGRYDDPQGEDLMTFEYFNKSSAKTKALTVTETFIKLLLQLKGVSVEKALAITNKYPTPRSLINAYVKCDRKEGEILLAHLKYGDLNRNVGPMTSKSIYQLFSSNGAD